MLRLNEIKLPLNHEEPELAKAILVRLKISPEQMLGFTVYKRSYDARKKANISLIYSVDVETTDDAGILAKRADDKHLMVSPDMAYKFVAHGVNADGKQPRPVVIGMGPAVCSRP